MNATDRDGQTHSEHHEITYFVNGEKETTKEPELTVKQILENAGFMSLIKLA